jgi:acyl carrier protein
VRWPIIEQVAPRMDCSKHLLNHFPESYACIQYSMESLIEELKNKIIAGFNLEGVTPMDIDPDAPIFGTGLQLDSIDALELVAILEQDYGLVILERSVADKAFGSLRTLAEFINANRT